MNEKYENSLYASLLSDTPEDAIMLDAWLDERTADLERTMDNLPEEIKSVRQNNRRLACSVGSFDKEIAPGQIRILSKRFTTDPDVIPYVAVLEEWHEGMWLVIPFSQYSYPATPGEMTTGLRHLGLRVMQVWNARTMQEPLLAKSFLFGELPDSVCQDGLSLFRHEMGGVDLPEGFDSLRGCAITMEADPRRDYVAETIARLCPLSTAVKATERIRAEVERRELSDKMGREFAKRIAKPKFIEEEMKLAAGTRKPRTECYDVGGISLDLEFSPETDAVVMTFYDEQDEKFLGYDGYGVIGRDEEFLGAFLDGSIRVSAEAVRGSFMLVDRDGGAVEIKARD
ncbi:MAG: hypothetical protein IKR48_04005 [Kiritimatiellae bacterium]|nr:hypothetical protein [Kiritimatiellia bacterium]